MNFFEKMHRQKIDIASIFAFNFFAANFVNQAKLAVQGRPA